MTRTQFNTRISPALLRRVKLDKVNTGATLDTINAVALEFFFTAHKPEKRSEFYRAAEKAAAKTT